ncbi:alpha/beta fold hydrolase [Halomonas sp. V046]|uniref:alpha/beta fold hydrolase n=1 Tax=Halomonas sp. V046 TaxID=3459611 RepID=UPI0040446EF9
MELHFTDTGGAGVPLVIVHGLLGSADNWRSHVKAWASHYRVIALDLRNHGRSPHASGMAYADMAHDVVSVLDRCNVDKAYLLGHSMGGKVVISLARLMPERVAALIVADIAPVAYDHHHDAVFAALRRVESGEPTDRRQADALLAEHIDEKPTRMFLATNLVRDGEGVLRVRVGLDAIEQGYADIMQLPAGDGSVDLPTLVLRGDRSDYVNDERLEATKRVLPRTELVTLSAGHWLHTEQAEGFQQAVNAFLSRLA